MKNLKSKIKYFIVIILIILMAISVINIRGKELKIANNKEIKKYAYNDPYIPEGFTHVDGTTVADGFVIQEIKTGNEFVWIPVDGTNVTLERKNFSVSDLSKEQCKDDTNPLFEESVNQYGGFYIARYEAGIPEGTTYEGKEKNVSGKPVSKKSQEVWNYINYDNAETSANQMYVENSEITSSLMSGQAWDTVLTWLGQNGYNVGTNSTTWGNYLNNEYTNGEVAKTGYEKWVAKNIYDLAGNVSEWTTERNGNYKIRRGGNYSNEGTVSPAGMREEQSENQFNNTTGFRVMIYKTGDVTIDGYDTPYIPSGFEYVEGEWNTGYVIKDRSNGNEFVWVPVDGINVKIERKDFSNNFASKDKATDRLDLQFKISVNTNGGFYIARYEAGQGTSSTGETLQGNVSGKPVSKKGVDTWTNIPQTQASSNAQKMYASHIDMQSKLISSYAYDMTMQWLENSGINVGTDSSSWGNYSTKETKSTKQQTGTNESNKVNNIYDLAGNVWELTTEKYNNGLDIVARGGDYLSTGNTLPAAARDTAKNTDAYNYMGYRTIIYKTTKVQGVEVPDEWDSNRVYAIEDEDGNIIPIPKEFHYVKGTKDTGIVISDNVNDLNKSDVEDNELEGNQFVWVPVDNISYFTRRTFGDSNVDVDATAETSNKYWEYVPEELIASVSLYKGYYVGRYEAIYGSGTTVEDYMPLSKASTSATTSSTNSKEKLWNYITRRRSDKSI